MSFYVEVPISKVKLEITKILKEEGFIKKYEHINKDEINKFIKIIFKYGPDNKSVIRNMERISKPGKRVYVPKKDIPKVLNGFGLAILSTNKGIMTGKQARQNNLGGELICTIW
jgi:small subunit ribosomal protein S8